MPMFPVGSMAIEEKKLATPLPGLTSPSWVLVGVPPAVPNSYQADLAAPSPPRTLWLVTRRLLRHSALSRRLSLVVTTPPGWVALARLPLYGVTLTLVLVKVGVAESTLVIWVTASRVPKPPSLLSDTSHIGSPGAAPCMAA